MSWVRSITRNIPLLRCGEIVIEEKQVGIRGRSRARDLLQLACANQGCGIGPVAPLQNFTDNFRACAARQGTQLSQRFFGVELWDAWFLGGRFSRDVSWSSSVAIRAGLNGGSVARGLRLCRNLCSAASARPHVEANQESAFLRVLGKSGLCVERHPSDSGRAIASLLGM
jgi:hypothetical protein